MKTKTRNGIVVDPLAINNIHPRFELIGNKAPSISLRNAIPIHFYFSCLIIICENISESCCFEQLCTRNYYNDKSIQMTLLELYDHETCKV